MKKNDFLWLSLVTLLSAMFVMSCSKDDEKNDENKIDILGTWQGEYSAYDPQQSKSVSVQRELVLNADMSYSNKIGGKMGSTGSFDVWEEESGSYSLSEGTITFNPSSSRRVNFRSNSLESYTKSSYSERLEIGEDGSWACIDNNLQQSSSSSSGVSYYIKRK